MRWHCRLPLSWKFANDRDYKWCKHFSTLSCSQWPGPKELPVDLRAGSENWGLWPQPQQIQGESMKAFMIAAMLMLLFWCCLSISSYWISVHPFPLLGWLLCDSRSNMGSSTLDCPRTYWWSPWQSLSSGPNQDQQRLVRNNSEKNTMAEVLNLCIKLQSLLY